MQSQEGFTIWFTGMTGSGKSTLALLLRDALVGMGRQCEVLDSGRIRQALNRSLGFTREEIEQNLRRIAYECKILNRNGIDAIVAAVSPYRSIREAVRKDVARWVQVYCRCPMEVLLKRDTKDLFGRAERGEIEHVAGINAPFEEPMKPEVLLNTDVEPPAACVAKTIATLQLLGYLPKSTPGGYTDDEHDMIKRRLQDLGYI